jgi:hypothetical protein
LIEAGAWTAEKSRNPDIWEDEFSGARDHRAKQFAKCKIQNADRV